jgi:tRNA pseudouridine38-40 synthase
LANFRLDLAYDGTGFHGYARQPHLRTVQGELEDALFKMLGEVNTAVAGRTDAGVHARHQVVNFHSDVAITAARIQRSVNGLLGPEIIVEQSAIVDDEFHARYSAKSRTYRYHILNRPWNDPFLDRTAWHYRHPLDLEAMNAAVAPLVGERDFAAFCRRDAGKSTIRHLLRAEWSREAELVWFEIEADSFCHQMVRSLVAVLVEVGRGEMTPDEMLDIAERGDRSHAKGAAPAHGLTLWEVKY